MWCSMCDIKEAERHERLAEIYLGERDLIKAVEHYLEATAIYVLNIELLKEESLLKKANSCYQKVQGLRGEPLQDFSKAKLAQLTVKELKFFPRHKHLGTIQQRHNDHDPVLSEIEVLL